MWCFLFPECFIIIDFSLNLFNKSRKNPNGGIGLKNVFEESIFNKLRSYNKATLPDIKAIGLFCFEIPLIKKIEILIPINRVKQKS